MQKFAVIDIGSNSVRLMLVADGKVLYKDLCCQQRAAGRCKAAGRQFTVSPLSSAPNPLGGSRLRRSRPIQRTLSAAKRQNESGTAEVINAFVS